MNEKTNTSQKKQRRKIVLFADATCDMPIEFIREHDIQIIGLRYAVGKTDGWFTVAEDSKQLDDFYMKMRKGDTASTSLVLYDDAYQAFEPFFKAGNDIIHIGLSSGLAKTYENALNAGTDLAKKYGCKFYAPDTKLMSAASYIIIRQLIKLIKDYETDSDCFEKIINELPKFYKDVRVFFTVEDLKYLHRSGRLGAAAKIIGGILKVKPIITADKDGKLATLTKKTGRLTSIQFLANQVGDLDPAYPYVFIIHGDSLVDAKLLQQKVSEIHPDIKTEIINMGFIIGAHTGPGTLGIGFKTKI